MNDNQFKVGKHSAGYPLPLPDSELYVVLQSSSVGNLLGLEDVIIDDDMTELLLKITSENTGKSIYRLGVARSLTGLTKNDINIGFRSRKCLGVNIGDTVTVSKTNWLCYMWHHCESHVRHSFRLALFFGLISLISFICQLCCFC